MLKVKTLEISKRKSFLLFWYFAWSTHLGCFHIFTRLFAEDLAVVNGDARPLEHHGQWRGEGQVWTPYQVRTSPYQVQNLTFDNITLCANLISPQYTPPYFTSYHITSRSVMRRKTSLSPLSGEKPHLIRWKTSSYQVQNLIFDVIILCANLIPPRHTPLYMVDTPGGDIT